MGVSVLATLSSELSAASQRRRCRLTAIAFVAGALAFGTGPAVAQNPPAAEPPAAPAAQPPAPAPAATKADPAATAKLTIPIVLARQLRDDPPPLSLLDLPPADDGIAGAKLAIKDNNTTGQFLNQEFTLDVIEQANPDDLIKDVLAKVAGGAHFVLADVDPGTLLKLADAVADKGVLIINYGAPDDSLREENCRAHVMHSAPTRTMLADALAQYLVWKKWPRWFLVVGEQEKDKLYAEAIRRAAKRFGAKIVEERTFNYKVGSRRTDGGYEQVQAADPDLHARRGRSRCADRRRRRRAVRRLLPLPHLDRATRRRHRGPRADELAPGDRAVGRHPIPEPLQAPGQSHHAAARLQRLDRRAHRSARRPRAPRPTPMRSWSPS